MEIKGRVALITGAASGIGRTYVEELLNHGAKVSSRSNFMSSGVEGVAKDVSEGFLLHWEVLRSYTFRSRYVI